MGNNPSSTDYSIDMYPLASATLSNQGQKPKLQIQDLYNYSVCFLAFINNIYMGN